MAEDKKTQEINNASEFWGLNEEKVSLEISEHPGWKEGGFPVDEKNPDLICTFNSISDNQNLFMGDLRSQGLAITNDKIWSLLFPVRSDVFFDQYPKENNENFFTAFKWLNIFLGINDFDLERGNITDFFDNKNLRSYFKTIGLVGEEGIPSGQEKKWVGVLLRVIQSAINLNVKMKYNEADKAYELPKLLYGAWEKLHFERGVLSQAGWAEFEKRFGRRSEYRFGEMKYVSLGGDVHLDELDVIKSARSSEFRVDLREISGERGFFSLEESTITDFLRDKSGDKKFEDYVYRFTSEDKLFKDNESGAGAQLTYYPKEGQLVIHDNTEAALQLISELDSGKAASTYPRKIDVADLDDFQKIVFVAAARNRLGNSRWRNWSIYDGETCLFDGVAPKSDNEIKQSDLVQGYLDSKWTGWLKGLKRENTRRETINTAVEHDIDQLKVSQTQQELRDLLLLPQPKKVVKASKVKKAPPSPPDEKKGKVPKDDDESKYDEKGEEPSSIELVITGRRPTSQQS
jgi:hypothetical protein